MSSLDISSITVISSTDTSVNTGTTTIGKYHICL